LNPKIRGWANYFRNCCAKRTFSYIDHCIFKSLWQWTYRRHPKKNAAWRKTKYFRARKLNNWVFFAKTSKGNSPETYLDLFEASSVPIKRHIKIRSEANIFDPEFKDYFKWREHLTKSSQRISTLQTHPGMIPNITEWTGQPKLALSNA
jgi:RNA-directed DNA polymerase